MPANSASQRMISAARRLQRGVDRLDFSPRVPWVYNPLQYAWAAHREYLQRYTPRDCRVVFLGMNPGPWGMAQCGVPFGEIHLVRNWLGITAPIGKPPREHPKRPVLGWECPRSEVSGKRLWGLLAERFGTAEQFAQTHFVANYCPLVFMEETARNLTPDKLPAELRQPLDAVCDHHLADILRILQPEWVIGVGGFAEQAARRVVTHMELSDANVGRILHPSPASPAANRNWSGTVTDQLQQLGVW